MTLSNKQRCAYQLRQKDTGWGRACAHLIPFYPIYYAWTRRTLTPGLWGIGLSLATIFIIDLLSTGKIVSITNLTEILYYVNQSHTTTTGEIFAMPINVIGIKLGINKSRQYAHHILKTKDQN